VDTVVLGRTGLYVTVAGLGCGGHSRLGRSAGKTEDESVAVVRRALDLGVNYIDTAQNYRTEGIVGRAVAGRRGEVVISTKVSPYLTNGKLARPRALRKAVHASLRNLGTDTVEVFHLHGVGDDEYDYCVNELVPELHRRQRAGDIGYIAISERFGTDTGHSTLQRAVKDDCWDVMMVGFNLLNSSARDRVFPATIARDIGVEVMFAVRRVIGRPDEVRRVVAELVADGRIAGDALDADDPLGFLVHEGGATSVIDAAYRFARHEPGCHVILTGTGDVTHLEANVRSIDAGPLPSADLERLRAVFGHLDHLSCN
jgi:aryl-alcohol dehydrogenase-like predicted oxidoreductase